MKRGSELVFLSVFVLALSFSFASAGISDFFKQTGQVTSEGHWTGWYDVDGPRGSGDYETLNSLRSTFGYSICDGEGEYIVDVECRAVGDKVDYSETGQNVVCSKEKGFYCKNENNEGDCLDYEVRFFCSEEEFEPTGQVGPCSDSDGGENYYEKGSVSMYGSVSIRDTCVTDSILNEFICGPDGTPMAIPGGYNCPSGVCENGACVKGEEDDKEITCVDSDGGKNIYEKGTTVSGEQYSSNDICSGSNVLKEFYCEENGEKNFDYFNCPEGYECTGGACVEQEEKEETCVRTSDCSSGFCSDGLCINSCSSNDGCQMSDLCDLENKCVCEQGTCIEEISEEIKCTDSDGGENIYVGGTIKTKDITTRDKCMTDGNLLEFVCNEDGSFDQKSLECPLGYECVEDSCVEEFCEDSDGDNIYVKGFITDENGVDEEYCLEERYAGDVMEFYCSGNKTIAQPKSCPEGYECSEGACVEKQDIGEAQVIPVDFECSTYASFSKGGILNNVENWFEMLNYENDLPQCEDYLVDRDGGIEGVKDYAPEGEYVDRVHSGYIEFYVSDYSVPPFKFETVNGFLKNRSIFSKEMGKCAFDSSWRTFSDESLSDEPVCYGKDPFNLVYSASSSTLNESYCRNFLISMKKGKDNYGSYYGGYLEDDMFDNMLYFPAGGKCINNSFSVSEDVCDSYYSVARTNSNWDYPVCDSESEDWQPHSVGPTNIAVFNEGGNFVGHCFGSTRTFEGDLGKVCVDPVYYMNKALLPENILNNLDSYAFPVLNVPKFSQEDCQVIWEDLLKSYKDEEKLKTVPSNFYSYEMQGGEFKKETNSVFCFNAMDDLEFDMNKGGEGFSPKETNEEQMGDFDDECIGCELSGECYPLGKVMDGKYCSENLFRFALQKSENEPCEQNFECSSDICVSGKCVSNNTWNRFLKWILG